MRIYQLLIASFAAISIVPSIAIAAGNRTVDQCSVQEVNARYFPLSELSPEAARDVADSLGVDPSAVQVRKLSIAPKEVSEIVRGYRERLVETKLELQLDASMFKSFAQKAARSSGVSSCRTSITPGNATVGVENDALKLSVPVTGELNFCASFTSICCRRA